MIETISWLTPLSSAGRKLPLIMIRGQFMEAAEIGMHCYGRLCFPGDGPRSTEIHRVSSKSSQII